MADKSITVDINEIYKKFILEVDAIRSDASNSSDLKESRCNAFYRLIGLPISDGNNLYLPGFDKQNNGNTIIEQSKKNTANKINKKLQTLMDLRESEPKKYASIFESRSVDSSVLAMSLISIRPFAASLKNEEDFFDSEKENQSYIVESINNLKNNVKDPFGGSPSVNISNKRFHFLKPFMVNPKIDSNITPCRNKIAVPFLQNKIDLKLSSTEILKRPYIEKVCRGRWGKSNDNYGEYINKILENIKKNELITNSGLINAINAQSLTSKDVQIINYLNMIESMIDQLWKAIVQVKSVKSKYNWIPIPNKNGPEIACDTRTLFEQQNDLNNTKIENDMIQLKYAIDLESLNNKVKDPVIDLGGFAFDELELTPDKNSSNAVKDNKEKYLKDLIKNRNESCDFANKSLRIIEIIMGEFSGLGLCDIFAICLALWSVDDIVLFNMLDSEAQIRAVERGLNVPSGGSGDQVQYLRQFEQKVKQIFNLMQGMFDKRSKTDNSDNKRPQ